MLKNDVNNVGIFNYYDLLKLNKINMKRHSNAAWMQMQH